MSHSLKPVAAIGLAIELAAGATNSASAHRRCYYHFPKFGTGYGPVEAVPAVVPTELFYKCGGQLVRGPSGMLAQVRPTFVAGPRPVPAGSAQAIAGRHGPLLHGTRFR
jgi:hypothetical protein